MRNTRRPVAQRHQGRSQQGREEDDLQHLAFGQGGEGVGRHDAQQNLQGRRNLARLHLAQRQVGQADARIDDVAERETHQHGQQGGDGEPDDRSHPQPHRADPFAQLGDRTGDGEQHQRRHHHADQVQIDVADRLQPDGRLLAQDQTGDDAQGEPGGGALPQRNGEEATKHDDPGRRNGSIYVFRRRKDRNSRRGG